MGTKFLEENAKDVALTDILTERPGTGLDGHKTRRPDDDGTITPRLAQGETTRSSQTCQRRELE